MKNLGPYNLNSIVTGECADVMSNLPDNCIDLTVTSPPYDNLRDYNGYTFEFEAIAQQLWRVTKLGGVVVWVVADQTIDGSETGTSFRQALGFMALGFRLHDTMIYQTDKPPLTHNRYEQSFEFMFVFSKGSTKAFNPIKEKTKRPGNLMGGGPKYPNGNIKSNIDKTLKTGHTKLKQNIWYFFTGRNANDKIASNHDAPFPEALARDHIISWSNPGDVVLDPMCGSGTTLKMAKELGRQYIGIDISQEYCGLSQRRVDGARVPLPGLDEPMPEPVQSTFAD